MKEFYKKLSRKYLALALLFDVLISTGVGMAIGVVMTFYIIFNGGGGTV